MLTYIHQYIVPAAYALLPPMMQSAPGTAMVLAIGLQESQFAHRRQMDDGPARGFYQFERGGGVAGVRRHPSSRPHLTAALRALQYPHTLSVAQLYDAIEHNDVLATVCARLLLWTLPQDLPARDEPDRAWDQYIVAWKPGQPHPETWLGNFTQAWELVG